MRADEETGAAMPDGLVEQVGQHEGDHRERAHGDRVDGRLLDGHGEASSRARRRRRRRRPRLVGWLADSTTGRLGRRPGWGGGSILRTASDGKVSEPPSSNQTRTRCAEHVELDDLAGAARGLDALAHLGQPLAHLLVESCS